MDCDAAEKVVIPLSKGKIVLAILGSIGFVAASTWLWAIADAQTRFNPLTVRGAALVGSLFFGLIGVYCCVKFFDRKPGLIMDREGLWDNSSAVSAGRIPWDEVTGLKVSTISGQRMLTIEVADPQKYVERGRLHMRILNAANTKLTGSPINIASNGLRVDFDELQRLISEAFAKYKGSDP